MTIDLHPFLAPAWRMIHPHRLHSPYSGEGARLFGGRWNMKGWPALYLAADPLTAIKEYYQGAEKPAMLTPFRVDAAQIADLTALADQRFGGRVKYALSENWKGVAGLEGRVPTGWALAQELIAAGAQGALVPSAQNRGGTNLVLWRWHAAHQPGGGAALTLLDPEASLSPRPGGR